MSEQACQIDLNLLLNSSSEILFVLNKGLDFSFINEAANQILGYSKADLCSKNVLDIVPSVHQQQVFKIFTDVLHNGEAKEFELTLADSNGLQKDFICTVKKGNNHSLYCSLKDLSENKWVEEKLVASQQRFKNLFLNSSDIVVVTDESGKFKYANHSASHILGFVSEDFENKNVFEFVHPDDMEKVFTDFYRAIIKKEPNIICEHRFRRNTGDWIWLETKATDLLHDKNIEGIVISSRDVTERKKLQGQLDCERENRRKEITMAVINAQEEERTQLSLELHDNVNQILGTVKLYCELLKNGHNMGVDLLGSSIELINYSINELRRISKRLSVPSIEEVDIQESIKELVFSILITNQLKIDFDIEGFENHTVSNPLHLTIYRIVQEQLNNILRYAKANHVLIKLQNTSQSLNLYIEDDGIGFNPKEKNSGIGFTNMKLRAESERGKLCIESEKGAGCRLRVSFPPLPACAILPVESA